MTLTRRSLVTASAVAVGFGGLARYALAETGATYVNEVAGYGPLLKDPAGVLDLPRGFSYRVIAQAGDMMSDGLVTPGRPDGMGCFADGPDRVILICNHENYAADPGGGAFGPDGALASRADASKIYDRLESGLPCPGGTTRLTYDLKARRRIDQHLSLAGTLVNCGGGATPRASWLSCEESVDRTSGRKSHGWVFEVPAHGRGLADPIPLTGMGRFLHEATATDARTGVVYLSEDRSDGLFYRFLPADPDRLSRGGRLQALVVVDGPSDLRNWPETGSAWTPGRRLKTEWIELDGVDSPNDDLRLRGAARGAALVARGEGLWCVDGDVYLACTSGGPAKYGQILRYRPGAAWEDPGELDLFLEPTDAKVLCRADNLAASPWGHMFVCEDRPGEDANHLRAIDPRGRVYTVARNAKSSSELAGVCFSPDGSTLFVNLQEDGITLAVNGPWTVIAPAQASP